MTEAKKSAIRTNYVKTKIDTTQLNNKYTFLEKKKKRLIA